MPEKKIPVWFFYPPQTHLIALRRLVEQQCCIPTQHLDASLPILRCIERRLEEAQCSGAIAQDFTTPVCILRVYVCGKLEYCLHCVLTGTYWLCTTWQSTTSSPPIPFHCLVLQFLQWHHRVDQPHIQCLLCIIQTTQKPNLPCFFLPHQSCHVCGSIPSIKTAHFGTCLPKDCIICCNLCCRIVDVFVFLYVGSCTHTILVYA